MFRLSLLALARELRVLGKAMREPTGIELQRHQQAAQHIVYLPRNARALFLAHRLQVRRELAQLRESLSQLVRALGNARFQLVICML